VEEVKLRVLLGKPVHTITRSNCALMCMTCSQGAYIPTPPTSSVGRYISILPPERLAYRTRSGPSTSHGYQIACDFLHVIGEAMLSKGNISQSDGADATCMGARGGVVIVGTWSTRRDRHKVGTR